MATRKQKLSSELLAELVVSGMQEKKGKDIVSMKFNGLQNSICDYFVICHGTSGTQVEALADSVEAEVKKATGKSPWHREGYENAEWILLDYVDVVAHIFQQKSREYYQLETLWADAETRNFGTIN